MIIERFDSNNPVSFARKDVLSPKETAWFVELGINRNRINNGDILIYDSEGYTLLTDEEYESDTDLAVSIDRQFGAELLTEYLKENKELKLTTQQSLIQLQKFQGVKALCEVGALTSARDVLSTIEPDEVFTQTRKNYYLNKLNNFVK